MQIPNSINSKPKTPLSEPENKLKIHEIFFSIQGESRTTGFPTTFVRLTACPLRCSYCDTEYAFTGGESMSLNSIRSTVEQYKTRYVTITGGEPLAQPNVHPLMIKLCDLGYQVSLETSGALDVSRVDLRVSKVMDLKTPASGECQRNLYSNLDHITANDQIKFVICNQEDYEWSRSAMEQYALDKQCEVIFSPASERVSATQLAEWILRDTLPVRLQIQLHKHLWGNQQGK